MQSLAAFAYLTTGQVARLHFYDDEPVAATADKRAVRLLTALLRRGLVERIGRRIGGGQAHPASYAWRLTGSTSHVWRLSSTGGRVLGLTRPRRSSNHGLQHLAHTLEIAEVAADLHERSRHENVTVVEAQTEPSCWREYLSPSGSPAWLKPDLRVTLMLPGHERHWFIEVDRGNEHRPALKKKARAYVDAWRDGGEQARVGVFPAVMWVVPDERRATELKDVCATVSGAPSGMFFVAQRGSALRALLAPSI